VQLFSWHCPFRPIPCHSLDPGFMAFWCLRSYCLFLHFQCIYITAYDIFLAWVVSTACIPTPLFQNALIRSEKIYSEMLLLWTIFRTEIGTGTNAAGDIKPGTNHIHTVPCLKNVAGGSDEAEIGGVDPGARDHLLHCTVFHTLYFLHIPGPFLLATDCSLPA
jgi:hypothetical protein